MDEEISPMPFDPTMHHRRSIRLQGHDYTQPGAYFVTICAQNRRPLFSAVRQGQLVLHDSGRMVTRWWAKLPEKFAHVTVDAFVIMPDHLHGILLIGPLRDDSDAGAPMGAPLRNDGDDCNDGDDGRPHRNRDDGGDDRGYTAPTLGAIVQWLKTMTTNEYMRGVKEQGWPAFDRRLWQRNYYERIIRTDTQLQRVRAYIANNPARWAAGLAAAPWFDQP